VYLEIGKKRSLAGACDWPGWCRGGRDEEAALQALLEYGPRYEQVLHATGLGFRPPADVSAFAVTERLEGNPTTDFGAPDVAPAGDATPVDEAELRRLQILLQACWTAWDGITQAATGTDLRLGPRGGGRDLAGILRHVLDAEASYLRSLGGKLVSLGDDRALDEVLQPRRQIILDAVATAAHGEFPSRGPRGGIRWTPRFFVRRDAWHILDHAWEVEDRML
jgi:hypothetical protein